MPLKLIYHKNDEYKRKRSKNPLNIVKNFIGSLKNYGGCKRCNDSWWWKESHEIDLGSEGIFPLCEECWNKIDTREKRFWVRKLELEWFFHGCLNDFHKDVIERALHQLHETDIA